MVIISHIVSSLITKFSILNILMNILHVFEHVSRLEFHNFKMKLIKMKEIKKKNRIF